MISSRENRWLQSFRSALAGKSEGAVGIEGARLVEEAFRSAVPVEAVLVSESGRKHLGRVQPLVGENTRILATTDKLFERLADTESPQGIAALIRPSAASFDDLLAGPATPLILVLVGVQDPGNVGTIIRSAEALGASGIATCRAGSIGTAHPFSPKALRASAGSVFRLPMLDGIGVAVLQAQLRVMQVQILAAVSGEDEADANSVAPWQADLRGAIALLIGNEGAGLPADVASAADARIRIPLAPAYGSKSHRVESLNAATAASILMYEAARQRAASTRDFAATARPAGAHDQ
ncbi:MAG TPA: RNA methyltransferase [Candidatus Acidoferrales bacterium]|nr:RNA methyltransferase [Candidatus Acidoferrales bacterium]